MADQISLLYQYALDNLVADHRKHSDYGRTNNMPRHVKDRIAFHTAYILPSCMVSCMIRVYSLILITCIAESQRRLVHYKKINPYFSILSKSKDDLIKVDCIKEDCIYKSLIFPR